MLRILIYDTNFVFGLSRTIYLTKIKYWQEKGAKISLFCVREGKNYYKKYLQNVNFYTLDFKYKIKGVYSLIWQVIKVNFLALFLLKKIKGKFDVVYSPSSVIDFVFIPWVLKMLKKEIKWFVMVDNLVPPPGKRPGSWFKNFIPYLAFLLGELMLKKASGIFVLTDSLKKHYEEIGFKNVIKTNDGYGVETEIFKGLISPQTPKVNALYCGRLHIAKGIFDLVDVAKLVVKQKPNFKIGILGDGGEKIKKEFYEKIEQAGLKNNFLHFGYQIGKKKADILRLSDFYLSLSYDESFGHAILEALACNKPVLAYDLPIYHEVFRRYLAGGQLILFKEKDFVKIAKYILSEEYVGLKFENKLEDYTWDKICQKEWEAFLA